MAEARTGTGMSDDLITCPICFTIFKAPKSLPCLHTFCKVCLQTFISKAVHENKPKVECPICRSIQDFTGQDVDQWIDSLPTNFIVNSLIERNEMQTGNRACEVCKHLGKSASATKWCQECSEAYCDECSKGHEVHKMLRKHNLMSITDFQEKGHFVPEEGSFDCSVHKNRKIELFCFDHTQPCCLTCMTVNHRKCDKVTTLEEAAENFRNDPTFVSFTKEMNELASELKKEATIHDKWKTEFALRLSKIKGQAHSKKQELVRHIETLYSKFEGDVSAIEKQHEADDRADILTQKITQVEVFAKTLETLKSTSSDLSVFLEFHKMKGKQNDFREFLEEFRSSKKQESVEFICHENVRKFDSVISSFGEVRVVNSLLPAQASKTTTIDYTKSSLKKVVTIVEATRVRFTDVVCLQTGTMLAIEDLKNSVMAYDNTGSLLSRSDLPCNPWALTVVDANQVVVTLRGQNSLQFFTYNKMSKTLDKGKTIHLHEEPWAIEYAEKCLYVTFPKTVRKLRLDGGVVKEFIIPESSNSLYGISYFNGNIIVVDHSFRAMHSLHVLSMDSNPHVKLQKKFSKTDLPVGVATDRDGNIYVSGWASNNVIQLSQSGNYLREILPSSLQYKFLMGINFSLDGMKFIMTHDTNKITVFEFH